MSVDDEEVKELFSIYGNLANIRDQGNFLDPLVCNLRRKPDCSSDDSRFRSSGYGRQLTNWLLLYRDEKQAFAAMERDTRRNRRYRQAVAQTRTWFPD